MRATVKIIHQDNIAHNLATLSALAPQAQSIAVVKANAYGCEAPQIISALSQADMLAVATIEEAQILRQAGATQPILLLEGVFSADELVLAAAENFEVVVATPQQLDWLLAASATFSRVWLKLDTGMGRLGFQAPSAHAIIKRLLSRYDDNKVVLMTHFADADAATTADGQQQHKTRAQIEAFDAIASHYPHCQQSLANSAATLAFPEAHRDYVRLGIVLYGVSPFAGKTGRDHGLKPVMTLRSRVFSLKHFKKGQAIGYGGIATLPYDGIVAVAAIGYADGYLRFIASGTPIIVGGREYQTIGRISMDMTTILVDERVKVGDIVECWGQVLPVERVAAAADTISYQLLTTVTERPRKHIF